MLQITRKIFVRLSIITSLTLLIYIFYKSEIIFEGTNRSHYLKYYLYNFSFLIFSILIYKLNKIINNYLNLSIISIIFSLYLFEFYLSKKQFILDKDLNVKIKKYREITGKEWDMRSQYQVYKKLLNKDQDTVPYFYPSVLNLKNKSKVHSLSGVSNSLTVFCNENGYYSINSSDRYGFNNPDTEWDAGIIDYVFVGDSFTHGYCVNRPHDIPSVIREKHNLKVLNLGYGRNGPLIEYATLREYLPQNVKKIVFMYYEGNDLDNLSKELENNILAKYLTDESFSQNLKSKQKLIDYEKRKHILARSGEENLKFIKLKRTRGEISNIFNRKININLIERKDENNLKKLEKILFLTKKLALKKKIDFYFVYLPKPSYYFKDEFFPDKSLYFKEIRSMVYKLDINFINIHKEVFEKDKNPKKYYPFEISGHYNLDGYKKVADTIYNFTK